MKIRYLTVPVAAAVTGLGFGAFGQHADAAVQRNQIQTLDYTVTVAGGFTHSYTVSPDPCDANFTGTGQYPASPAPATYNETLSGSVGGAPALGVSLNYTDIYFNAGTNQPTGYTYTFSGAFTDTAGDFAGTISDNSGNSNLPTTGKVTGGTSTNYANHGQFVKASPNKNDAAHSCVGMPVQSNQQ